MYEYVAVQCADGDTECAMSIRALRRAAHLAPGTPGCARATPSGSRCSRTPRSSCNASARPTAGSSRSCLAPDRAASAAAGSPALTCTGSVAACAQHHLQVEAELYSYEYTAALVSIADHSHSHIREERAFGRLDRLVRVVHAGTWCLQSARRRPTRVHCSLVAHLKLAPCCRDGRRCGPRGS